MGRENSSSPGAAYQKIHNFLHYLLACVFQIYFICFLVFFTIFKPQKRV